MRALPLSELFESTLRLTRHLPSPLRENALWWLFRKPFLHQRSAEQLAFLRRGLPFWVPYGPYRLPAFRYPGPGPTVLLTHGWQGSAASWYRLAPRLQQAGFNVIAYHAPGHSAGPSVASLADYSGAVETMARLVAPVAALVGHSFGGMASARAASALPPLGALVVIAAPDQNQTLLDNFCRRFRLSPFSRRDLQQRLEQALGRPLSQESTSGYLQGIACPTLVLHDRADEMIPTECAVAMSRAPHVQLRLTEGLGHRGIIRDDQALDQVVRFLEETLSGSPSTTPPGVDPLQS